MGQFMPHLDQVFLLFRQISAGRKSSMTANRAWQIAGVPVLAETQTWHGC
jgi:hypothetical protein